MSYCVNCGVELAQTERICPLCQTEAINPRSPWREPEHRLYPNDFDRVTSSIDRRYIASLMTVALLIPVFVTVITDLLSVRALTWSGYVVGAGAMLFVWVILPLYCRCYRRTLFLGLDCLAIMLYLLFIDAVLGRGLWFVSLGLPISATFSLLLLVSDYLFRRGSGQLILVRAAIILVDICLLALAVEIPVDVYVDGIVRLSWSPFVIVPCAILAFATQIVERRRTLKEEIRKRIYY